MLNQELAKIFREIADFLEMEETSFRSIAYKKAALAMESTKESIGDIYKKGGLKLLEEIPGIGENIALKIEEYIKTGKIKSLENLKNKTPINLEEMIAIEGVGPRKAKLLYQKLGIRNIKELEKAAKAHKISPLFSFGEKTEKNILEGIAFLKKSKNRFLLGDIMPEVESLLEKLGSFKGIKKMSIAGSVRRGKETVGDVDILATLGISKNTLPRRSPATSGTEAGALADFFISIVKPIKIWAKGKTKISVRTKAGFDIDLRIVPEISYGSALQYFTGSKEHNIMTRRIAMDKGLKLNEYGIFKGKKIIAGATEEGIYKAIGLNWIEPELRENQGEIEASLQNSLPKLVKLEDIKGDLHCHSNWDGGENSIKEMAEQAMEMGYQYIGIADHTKFLKIENGLDEKQLLERNKEIDKLNQESGIMNPAFAKASAGRHEFKILKGCEANILNDGSLDIKDEVLSQLDFVIAGVHSNLKMDREKMTERIIKAMQNPNVDIISHPTGRLLFQRDEYLIDFDKILKAAKNTGTILEINSWPGRLDLKDTYIRRAKKEGVKMIINSDAHHKNQMQVMKFGVIQARRGWAEGEDIINTSSVDELLKFFKS